MKFYSNLDLKQNQLLQAVLENVSLGLGTQNPLTGVSGQIVFNTDDNLVYIYNGGEGVDDWVTIGSAATITVNGGTHVDITNGSFDLNQMNNQTITIDHADITTTDTTSNQTRLLEQAFTVVDSIITDGQGHVTGFNVKTVTVNHPKLSEAYSTSANNSTTLNEVEFLVNLTVDDEGHVSEGEFRKLVAGNTINVIASSNGNITIDHDSISRNDSTNTGETPNFGDTITRVDEITTNNEGHVTEVKTREFTIPELTVIDEETGTWLTDVEISQDEVTLRRSDETEAKITIGELHVKETSAGSATGDALIDNDLNVGNDLTVEENTELKGNLLVGGNTTITGDLTVQGTTTTLNTNEVTIEDNLILINSNQSGTPDSSLVSGIEVERGNEDNYKFVFVENSTDFRIGKEGSLQPVLTRDEVANLTNDQLLVWDSTNKRAIGKDPEEISIVRKKVLNFIEDIPANTNQTLTHNLNTKDVTVTLYDNSNDEIFYATTRANTVNTIQVSFGNLPSQNSFRAVITG